MFSTRPDGEWLLCSEQKNVRIVEMYADVLSKMESFINKVHTAISGVTLLQEFVGLLINLTKRKLACCV